MEVANLVGGGDGGEVRIVGEERPKKRLLINDCNEFVYILQRALACKYSRRLLDGTAYALHMMRAGVLKH